MACATPPPDPDVWTRVLRREPRVVLAPRRHPLADRRELTLEDVLDETFIGLHPSVEPAWAGFWSLDDHRGGPPARLTSDHAANPQEVLASLVVRDAITTVPAAVARAIAKVSDSVIPIRLLGAAPATIVLAGRKDRRTAHVMALLHFADELDASR